MSLIGLLALTENNGPRGSPSHETFLVAPQGELEISSVARQPPLMRPYQLTWTGGKIPSMYQRVQILTNVIGWGAHLDQDSVKGQRMEEEKRLYINVPELKAVCLGLKHFRIQ